MRTAPAPRTEIHRADLMAADDYERLRADRIVEIEAAERDRRLPFGPAASLRFESYDTAWFACHERLRASGWDEDTVDVALAEADARLPKGQDLVAHVEPGPAAPSDLGPHLSLRFAGEVVEAEGTGGLVRFVLTPGQAERFRQPQVQVVVGCAHPAYGHLVAMPEAMRRALSRQLS